MKKFRKRFTVKVIVYLFLIGLLFGLLYYFSYKPDLNAYIDSFIKTIYSSNQNIILFNIGAVSALFLSSIIMVSMPLVYLYIFIEGFSIGYTLGLFIITKGLKGLLFYSLFFIICKFIYIIIIIYFTIMCTKYIENIIKYIKDKNKEYLYNSIINNFYRYIFVLIIVLLNSIFIYFYGNKLLLSVISLIK